MFEALNAGTPIMPLLAPFDIFPPHFTCQVAEASHVLPTEQPSLATGTTANPVLFELFIINGAQGPNVAEVIFMGNCPAPQ